MGEVCLKENPTDGQGGSGISRVWPVNRFGTEFRLLRLHKVTVVRLRNSPLTEPCPVFMVPIISKSVSPTISKPVKKPAKKNALQVCLISPHPLVLSDFERMLANPDFKTVSRHLESTLGPDLRHLPVPKATVYVVDAHVAKPAAGALLSNILDQHTGARIIVVAEKFDAEESYSLLQMGAKGLLSYTEARQQLPRALPLVANGGFWVPRSVLSGFVDSVLAGSHSRRLKVDTTADLSRREQEVLNSLLENLANKEIGNKLNISERTVKFHVSNLLSKFGVRRRADLILLCYQKRSTTP
jgi:two-component system nitrate/nitrite response regulator NarL